MEDQKLDKQDLMDRYGDYILTAGKRPANVYVFAKSQKISESDFYHYFSGFEALESEYLAYFFDQSLKLTAQMEGYADFEPKERLLNLYYVFIENLTMNRSLVLMIFDTDFRSKIHKLKTLKKRHQQFVRSLNLKGWLLFEKMPPKIRNCKEKPREEILWKHFLSVLRFWITDRSPDFEKTDLYIEKSIDTGIELVNSSIPEKILDLSKFLWKERF